MPSYENELAQIVAELNRAAPGSREPQIEKSAGLDQLLEHAAQHNASDLLLIAGAPVTLRVHGSLAPGAGPNLKPDDTRDLLLPLLAASQFQELQQNKSIDWCFTRE